MWEWNGPEGKYLLCLIDSFLAVMLIWVDLLPFVFGSCGEYYGNGMEWNGAACKYLVSLIDSFLAVVLTRMDHTFFFLIESCVKYCANAMEQDVSISFS